MTLPATSFPGSFPWLGGGAPKPGKKALVALPDYNSLSVESGTRDSFEPRARGEIKKLKMS